jgi:translation initiation factor IF-3
MAEQKNLDLVMISPNAEPPVCRIMDYGKYRFERIKKEKEARKNQQVVKVKEIQLSCTIDTHDFDTRVNHAHRFLADGNKVKVTTTTRVRKLACTRLSKAAIERRNWSKFGDAASGDDASARLTVVSTEEIFLERPRAPGSSTLFIHPRLGLRRLICFGSTTVLLAIFVIELGWIDLIHCGTRIIKPRLAIYLVYVGTGL